VSSSPLPARQVLWQLLLPWLAPTLAHTDQGMNQNPNRLVIFSLLSHMARLFSFPSPKLKMFQTFIYHKWVLFDPVSHQQSLHAQLLVRQQG
jgi:hypothetical protein